MAAAGLLALLYAPTRLIQEANPGWRLVSWALALEVVGLTLITLRLATGILRRPFAAFVFPVCFFLVAVPWPTAIESSLIQSLTHMDVAVTCRFVGWLDITAVPHGNVIQLITGPLGVDDACSGIRSFQATLMISLFLGEFYALRRAHRLLCIGAGFALALLLNLIRLVVLVWVADGEGIPAVAVWHDPTGIIILLGCFFSLWGIGQWLATKNPPPTALPSSHSSLDMKVAPGAWPSAPSSLHSSLSSLRANFSFLNCPPRLNFRILEFWNFSFLFSLALGIWLLAVELGVEGWYRYHEARLPAPVEWQVAWPVTNPTYRESGFAPVTRQMLRFDEGHKASWQADGLDWQVVFLAWKPGVVSQQLAESHTPDICMPASGHQVAGGHDLRYLTIHGLNMPFRFYQLLDTPKPIFVAYCLWDDRASARTFAHLSQTWGHRLAPVLAGQRNSGQRSIEIALAGPPDLPAARQAIQNLLDKIIVPVH